jgi:hypothetical protein
VVTTELGDIVSQWGISKNDGLYRSRELFELSTLAYPSIVVVTTELGDIVSRWTCAKNDRLYRI